MIRFNVVLRSAAFAGECQQTRMAASTWGNQRGPRDARGTVPGSDAALQTCTPHFPTFIQKVSSQRQESQFSGRVFAQLAEACVREEKRVLYVQRLQREQLRSEIRSHAVSQKDTNLLARLVERHSVRGRRGPGHAIGPPGHAFDDAGAAAPSPQLPALLQHYNYANLTFDAICTFPTILNCVTHALNYLFNATALRQEVKLESFKVWLWCVSNYLFTYIYELGIQFEDWKAFWCELYALSMMPVFEHVQLCNAGTNYFKIHSVRYFKSNLNKSQKTHHSNI